jgi:ABC-2 type transport system permease protein
MTLALHAEWTKLRSLRSTTWSLVAAVALMLALGALVSATSQSDGCPSVSESSCDDVVLNSLGGVYLAQMAVATLAVLAIGTEYGTGMIRTTFGAMPRRRIVLAAKAAVVAAVVFVVGLAVSVVAFELGQQLLRDGGYTAENGYPPVTLADGFALRAVVGCALYLAVLSVLSLGVGALLRSTAAALTAVFTLLWVPLIVVSLMGPDSGLEVAKFTPMLGGLAVLDTVERADSVPIGPWAGLGVLCAYAGVAMVAALWAVTRRDA